jgi:DNA polymerase III epsilon subunit-like protein
MKLLFFDTETNGLPKDRRAIPQQVNLWPHILQLAWCLVETQEDGSFHICDSRSLIVNPGDISWNAESAAIHGITPERVQSEGISSAQALNQFKHVVSAAHVLIAHNIAFDKSVLRAEYYRLCAEESFDWWPPYEYCTMESTKHLTKLPFPNGRGGRPNDPYKLPKLVELHTYLFGNPGTYVFHDALNDVNCTIACFQEMIRRRLVVPFDQWTRALRVRENRVVAMGGAGAAAPEAASGPTTRSKSAASSP